MMPKTTAPVLAAAAPWFPWLKGAIFALLVTNAVGYALFGRPTEAIDSLAWLTLLALFELETAYPQRMQQKRVAATVRTGRLVAGIAVVMAAIGFVREHEWLDAVNAMLWIAVVILFEFEVRRLDIVERHRPLFAGIAGSLYTAMAALVLIWAWSREWFDAYDALLWLIAFVALELNVLGIQGEPAVGPKAPC
jgi:hypothetical protein